MKRTGTDAGFSLLELLLATAIFAAAMALMFGFLTSTGRAGWSHPDKVDVNQRLRIAAAMLERDLLDAGSGVVHGAPGALADYLPPIRPARDGAEFPDPELSAFSDRISILQVPTGGWAARLAADMPSPTAPLLVNTGRAGCSGGGICGFLQDSRALILNDARLGAGYDVFTVTGLASGIEHGPPNPPFSQSYTISTSLIASVRQRVYYLDKATSRLMVYDGFKTTFPAVDNVVALNFSYFVDPHPAAVVLPPDAAGNCAFSAGSPAVPLLTPLSTATLTPVPLTQFTDGPYCGLPPNRFDADLLRIRRVRVTLRVQAGRQQSRGTGSDFVQAGSSANAADWAKDFEVSFDVAPRSIRPKR